MYHGSASFSWETLLRSGLEEDGWPWDWTSLGVDAGTRVIGARIIAKSAGVWAAGPLGRALEKLSPALDSKGQGITVPAAVEDGRPYKKGEVLCRWRGPARSVLALERPFLNLAAYVCGIATETQALVAAAKKASPKRPPRIVLTRKTLPGYRDLAIHAVLAGGGHPHRLNLAGGVLIKENHVAAAGGIAKAIAGAREAAPHGLKIEVEVRDSRELEQAIRSGAEGVLLDNFTPQEVKRALAVAERASPRPFIEVSGGVHAGNIARYALEGVDVISVGAITHSVRAADLSLLVDGT